MEHLVEWRCNTNLSLNVNKNHNLIVNFRKTRDIMPEGKQLQQFQGINISEDLSWAISKKVSQHLYFLSGMLPKSPTSLNRYTAESTLTGCIEVCMVILLHRNTGYCEE